MNKHVFAAACVAALCAACAQQPKDRFTLDGTAEGWDGQYVYLSYQNDTIRVQLSTQTRESHDYWNAYQDELLNGQNPLFPAHASLPTNIRGGIGIWAGYGSIQRTVVLRQLPTGY